MINLIIDIGNSRTKVALFNQGEMMISFPDESFTPEDLEILLSDYQGINHAILSSVKEEQSSLLHAIKKRILYFIELTHHTPLPLTNKYDTPKTLGKDRIAAVAGAQSLFPSQHILVIDAGTAITYDFISKEGVYNGGFITPGLRMRFQALHHFTDKLPLLEPAPQTEIMGINTISSIRGGVQYGLEGEVKRMTEYFTHHYGESLTILTGGDATYLHKMLPQGIVNHELTLLGLNAILEFNLSNRG